MIASISTFIPQSVKIQDVSVIQAPKLLDIDSCLRFPTALQEQNEPSLSVGQDLGF